METIQERNDAFANVSSFAERVILRANTIPPNQSIRGYVFYERDKKAKLVMLTTVIGDTIYQFPFEIDLF
jgi:L-fucose mutarotase/ribose pyranase (RbsD/FucU family)